MAKAGSKLTAAHKRAISNGRKRYYKKMKRLTNNRPAKAQLVAIPEILVLNPDHQLVSYRLCGGMDDLPIYKHVNS